MTRMSSNFFIMIITAIITLICLSLDIISGVTVSNERNNTLVTNSSVNIDHYSRLQAFQMTKRNMCRKSGANFYKDYNKTFRFFLNEKTEYRKPNSKSLLTCYRKAEKNNPNLTIEFFNTDFLHFDYPTSYDCRAYQRLLSKSKVETPDLIKIKVGKLSNIDIFAIVPSQFSDVLFIENFMHKNIDRVKSMLKDESVDSTSTKEKSSVSQFVTLTDMILYGIQLLKNLVGLLDDNMLKNSQEYKVSGPASLLYL